MSDEMDLRNRLARQVNTTLSKAEQETSIHFYGHADKFELTTYRPTLVKSTLHHSHAEIDWLFVYRTDERGSRVSNLSELADDPHLSRIEGVRARFPLGALTVKGKPRTTDRISKIMTTPEEADAASEAFGGERHG